MLPRDSKGAIIMKNFEIPMEVDLTPYQAENVECNSKYRLKSAIVFDFENLDKFHYYALVKKKIKNLQKIRLKKK